MKYCARLLVIAISLMVSSGYAQFKIVGYLPQYRVDAIDVSVGQYLDDLIYFNLRLNADASLDWSVISENGIRKVQEIKRRYGVRTQICIGGWYTAEGKYFAPVIKDPVLRSRLVQNLLDFCTQYDFDGVDYDWEHPQNEAETNAYADLFEETKAAFEPHGKIVSAAVSRWHIFPKRAYDVLDKIHIMAYNGETALNYNYGVSTAEVFLQLDIPREKLYLGTPFYGYQGSQAYTYDYIVRNYNPGPEFNIANGISYQGIYAQERRVQYAHAQNMGGMMIWEIGQDSPGEMSLLRAIHHTAHEMEKLPPPESISLSAAAGQLELRFSPVAGASSYRVYLYSSENLLVDSLDTNVTALQLETPADGELSFAQVVAINSTGEFGRPSRVMAASPAGASNRVVIVNDYDLWRTPADMIVRHASLLAAAGYSVASICGPDIGDSALFEDNPVVDWMVGDKGHYAPPLSENNRTFLQAFLEQGGRLFISGSNIGYGLFMKGTFAEKSFFIAALKSVCRDDAPQDRISQFYTLNSVPGSIFDGIGPVQFDNGNYGSYNVFDPDVIDTKSFGHAGFVFAGLAEGASAACSYYHGPFGSGPDFGSMVYLTVPFESITSPESRSQIMERILRFFQPATEVARGEVPEDFQVFGNYPNPFNSGTTIEYRLSGPATVSVRIYNALGETVAASVERQPAAGAYRFHWDAGQLPAGPYFYEVKTGAEKYQGKMLCVK